MNPIVSVIIPAYNTGAYIGKAIESVLQQTLIDIEIVIVDDASTDETVAIVQSFTDERIRLLQNPQNLGAGGARNRALKAAKGKWIAVLDSDDWYAPKRLEKLVAIAEAKNADLITDDLYLVEDRNSLPWGTLIGESGERVDTIRQIDLVDFVESDIEGKRGLHLGFTKPLFKREFLENHNIVYDETIKVSQDFWLDMDCLRHGARFFLVPEPYYYYRSRPGSLVHSDKIKRLDNECMAIANFLNHQDFLQAHPRLLQALLKKKAATQNYLDYYRFVEPLKKGNIISGISAINLNFLNVVFLFIKQIPGIIDRRVQSGLKGNRLVNNQMYQGNLSRN